MDACTAIAEVRVLDGLRLELTFDDGTQGTVDLAPEIMGQGGVFKPLQDPAYFRKVRIDPELGTIVWPNHADFCPELLHSMVVGTAASSNPKSRIENPK